MLVWRCPLVQVSLIIALGMLSGCYETPFRLLESGSDAGLLAGEYDCTVPGNHGTTRVSLVRQTASATDIIYYYKYDDVIKGNSAIARLGKLESGQDVLQIEGIARGMANYSFVAIGSPKTFTIWLPVAEASQRARDFGLDLRITGRIPTSAELNGTKEEILAFLNSFKPEDLFAAFACRHVDA